MMSRVDYAILHHRVFDKDHTGYRPEVVESPHGDGKFDYEKRYAHVALKYQHKCPDDQVFLDGYFMQGFRLALRVAKELGVPERLMPAVEACALRVLEYQPGASSAWHTDFNLFTLMLYRDQPDKFVMTNPPPDNVRALNAHCHLGELAEIFGLGTASGHEVLPSDTAQHSVVFFALPRHSTRLPSEDEFAGPTVGEWLGERIARSRAYR